MAVSFHHLVIDGRDLPALAHFWCGVLAWRVLHEDDGALVIGRDLYSPPGICFVPVPERKTLKNRLHIDLAPDDQAAEVERITLLGGRLTDVGQPADASFVVMADPEGNEFCVLSPMRSLAD